MTTYTHDIAPEGGRARIQALRRTAADAGMLTAPLAGGLVANLVGAPHFFTLYAPLLGAFGIATLLLAWESPESKLPPHPRRPSE